MPPGGDASRKSRDCTKAEVEDYYYDENFDVDCQLPASNAPKFEYIYNDKRSCPNNTSCTIGNRCGSKGTLHLINIDTQLYRSKRIG